MSVAGGWLKTASAEECGIDHDMRDIRLAELIAEDVAFGDAVPGEQHPVFARSLNYLTACFDRAHLCCWKRII